MNEIYKDSKRILMADFMLTYLKNNPNRFDENKKSYWHIFDSFKAWWFKKM